MLPSGSFTNQYLKQVPFVLVTSLNTRALNQPIAQLLWSEVIQTFLCHYHILIVVIASRVANSTGKSNQLSNLLEFVTILLRKFLDGL